MFRKLRQLFNSATEMPRAAMELGVFRLHWNRVKDSLPDGDGHPVLIFPGFMTGDSFTTALRDCAAEKGYKAYGWDGGVNFGFDENTAAYIRKRLQQVYDENGGKKVTLVGHSLGGVYARELAREFPHMVRGVVTMGTPFGMLDDPAAATSKRLELIYSFFNPDGNALKGDDLRARGLTPPPVPTTSIYSKDDGIVDWRAALNPAAPKAENIEVLGSHTGMPFNPHAVVIVLDRLAQAEGSWKPFDAAKYKKLVFPANDDEGETPKNPGWKPPAGGKPLFGGKPKP